MVRVLHVITGLASGGAEQQLRELIRHSRCEAEVVALTNAGVLADELRSDGVAVTDLGMASNTELAALPRLARIIRNGDFDVVHTHLYRACLYGRLAARWAGCSTVVATEHSLGERTLEGRPTDRRGVRALYLAAERLGQMTIAVSPTVLDLLTRWGVPRHRIRMIPNGIDRHLFRFDPAARGRVRAHLGLTEHSRVVGVVGRLVPTKQLELLIHAVRYLPDVILLLVGDGAHRAPLEELARQWGIERRVIFAGDTRDVRAMLSAMDLYVSTSPQESFGLAILEAIASGLPTIYVNCPAIDDLHERPPGVRRVSGRPDALRPAITEFLAHRSRLVAPELPMYDITHTAAQVDDLYRSLLTQPAAPLTGRPA